MQPFTLAIVGLGTIADAQLKALSLLNTFRLVAGCDRQELYRSKLPADASFYTKPEQMPLDEFDHVLISVPPADHADLAIFFLNAGKNVLVEKPLTVSTAQLDQVVDVAKRSPGILVTALHAAFGKEVLWFEDALGQEYSKLGPISFFHSRFFDPYLVDGELVPRSTHLGGSWLDSGINALSVIARLLKEKPLEVENIRSTRVPSLPVGEIQTNASFWFPIQGGDKAGYGIIETNWSLGINQKTTLLRFFDSKTSILLHHSNQQVIRIDPSGAQTIIADFSTTRERLVNHYLGVFADFAQRIVDRRDNLEHSYHLHQLLFASG